MKPKLKGEIIMKQKKEQYFRRQGLWGVASVIFAVISCIAGDALVGLFFAAAGVYLIFTSDMVWTNDLYFEIKEMEREKESE